jgi:hypothetical protein
MTEGKIPARLSLFGTEVSQFRGSLHVIVMRRNGFRRARKYSRIEAASIVGV